LTYTPSGGGWDYIDIFYYNATVSRRHIDTLYINGPVANACATGRLTFNVPCQSGELVTLGF